jgi:hypothetical protein
MAFLVLECSRLNRCSGRHSGLGQEIRGLRDRRSRAICDASQRRHGPMTQFVRIEALVPLCQTDNEPCDGLTFCFVALDSKDLCR